MLRKRHRIERYKYTYKQITAQICWLIPVIGHMGICTSSGVVHDFAGPYTVNEDSMAFGWPTKYWQLEPSPDWDAAVREASQVYCGRVHNLCCDNCHSHVALALNLIGYGECRSWNMVKLFFVFTWRCRYVSWPKLFLTWLPFLILATGILCFIFLFRPSRV